MARSTEKFWKINFILRMTALICLNVIVNVCRHWTLSYLTKGYELACLSVILSLIITYAFFESALTSIAEICFLVTALVHLIAATMVYLLTIERETYDDPDSPYDDTFFGHLALNVITALIIAVDIFLSTKK